MYKYITYQPDNISDDDKNYPLLVFLHGAPQRGDDFTSLKKVELPLLLETKEISIPMFVVAPLCPSGESWDSQAIMEVVNELKLNTKIDRKRIYLTGFSMGGFGSLKLLKDFPSTFSACAAVCSGGSRFFADYIKDIPLWFFHGKKDNIIEIEKTLALVKELETYGVSPKLTIYEDLGHRIWHKVYRRSDLYEWFLKH